jgi:hypothetical protein
MKFRESIAAIYDSLSIMDSPLDALPDDVETLKAALISARMHVARVEGELASAQTHATRVEDELVSARARSSEDQALIAHLKLTIAKLNRERFGARSERTCRLVDQLELQLEELEATATEDELAAEAAKTGVTEAAAFTRKRPSRKPFPDHLPRERVVVPGPSACPCCGGTRLSKLAKTKATGKKPGGFPPQPPTHGPRPTDQINLTDEESRIMPVAGGGFDQCYNAQAAVAAGSLLVVATNVVQAPTDKQQIEPMLAALKDLPDEVGQAARAPTARPWPEQFLARRRNGASGQQDVHPQERPRPPTIS